jgi:hypothetical protein
MKERVNVLQIQFLSRFFTPPTDALLIKLMLHIHNKHQQWHELPKLSIREKKHKVQTCLPVIGHQPHLFQYFGCR